MYISKFLERMKNNKRGWKTKEAKNVLSILMKEFIKEENRQKNSKKLPTNPSCGSLCY